MPIRLNSFGGGSVTVDVPSTASNFTANLPAVNGNLVSTGSSGVVTPTMMSQPLTLMSAQATTSGTFVDFTGIPSWARRVTVMFSGVSTNGSSHFLIQLGSGSITSSGYISGSTYVQGGVGSATATSTAGIIIFFGNATNVQSGCIVFNLISGNSWIASGITNFENAALNGYLTGRVTLSGILDRVRLTTVNGTDAFDAGSINVMYEG